MKTDIQIQQEAKFLPIEKLAKKLALKKEDLYFYGPLMAKVEVKPKAQKGKLILVSAINPTKAGEGKTTIAIGLADALTHLGKKAALALREPSLGPVFGIKGGATGGGFSQVAPMEQINLHFTGDMHAITAANNLLSAMIDNHIHWGNDLKIDTIAFKRCVDLNDRALRNVSVGGGYIQRRDNFTITAASEIMAILCLASDADDLLVRLGRIVIGYTKGNNSITAKDLGADGAMAVLLKDAIKPNLVQTLEGTAALIHGGPFANIAHGCNSIIATKTALGLADFVVTEAGFGADLGAEKFLNIKCREANITPNAVVMVASIRALKALGGKEGDLGAIDMAALEAGCKNLQKHVENMRIEFGLPCVVAINSFYTDTAVELDFLKNFCRLIEAPYAESKCFVNGGKGSVELAEIVLKAIDAKNNFKNTYELTDSLKEKIEAVALKVYGANGVDFSDTALNSIEKFNDPKYSKFPICIAKTQYSLSDSAKLLGAPKDFKITVRDIELRAGAGFFVVLCGDMLLMPALSKAPAALGMRVVDGKVEGLF